MIITTFEHAILTQANFTHPTDFDWLIEQNFDGFGIGRKQQQWQLKVSHYIGVIGLPSGNQLEILPKISQVNNANAESIKQTRQWLQRMLKDIWHTLTPKNLPNLAKQTPINPQLPLNDWLAHAFWQGFQRYQPNRQYQGFEQNQPYLQGKLLVKQQLQHNHHQPHKFFHQSEHFAVDTACNQLIKATLRHLIGGLPPDLSRESCDWQAVSTILPSQYAQAFYQSQQELSALPSTIAHHNARLVAFCYALLTLTQASGQGQSQSQALLINMQFAFEKWVGHQLKQSLTENAEVFEQFSQPLTLDKQLIMKPDILVKSQDTVKVMDIKWKTVRDVGDISLSDMYQLLTYASQFGASEAWLIVPTLDKHKTRQTINLTHANPTQFYLVPFWVLDDDKN
ncbi:MULTISPECIES: McrC family protein [unclassified Moraxella]|uniref:McrC family protein n=1 Tax=unclassified Moraxella TaxID=2685852 RepID=UPI003AF842C8